MSFNVGDHVIIVTGMRAGMAFKVERVDGVHHFGWKESDGKTIQARSNDPTARLQLDSRYILGRLKTMRFFAEAVARHRCGNPEFVETSDKDGVECRCGIEFQLLDRNLRPWCNRQLLSATGNWMCSVRPDNGPCPFRNAKHAEDDNCASLEVI